MALGNCVGCKLCSRLHWSHQVGACSCQKFNCTGLALCTAVWMPSARRPRRQARLSHHLAGGKTAELCHLVCLDTTALYCQRLPLVAQPRCCLTPCSPGSWGLLGGALLGLGTAQWECGELPGRHSCLLSRGCAETSRCCCFRLHTAGRLLWELCSNEGLPDYTAWLGSVYCMKELHWSKWKRTPDDYIIQAVRFLNL